MPFHYFTDIHQYLPADIPVDLVKINLQAAHNVKLSRAGEMAMELSEQLNHPRGASSVKTAKWNSHIQVANDRTAIAPLPEIAVSNQRIARSIVGAGKAAMAAFFLFLVACTTPGSKHHLPYPEHPMSFEPVPPLSGRLTVYRTSPEGPTWYFPFTASGASIVQLDGVSLGAVGIDEYFIRDASPGHHILRAELPGWPGKCDISIDLTAGTTHAFEVAPRRSYFLATLPGQMVSGVPILGLVVGPAAEFGGAAAESVGQVCGGPFSIAPVEVETARIKLANLRSSD
jgi:hypothetical protein